MKSNVMNKIFGGTCWALICAGVALPAADVLADPPVPFVSASTYQGYLVDGSAPVNGVVDMEFYLFTVEEGSEALYAYVPEGGVLVTDGLFNVEIDFPDSPIESFNGEERWLEIRVNEGESTVTLTPRQRIAPVPYALYAQKTRGLVVNEEGDVAIGETDPLANLHVQQSDIGVDQTMLSHDDVIVEDTDARMSLYSNGGGTWGSGISLGEVAGGVLQDKWWIARGTGQRLHFLYGDQAGLGSANKVFHLHSNGWAVLRNPNPPSSVSDDLVRMDASDSAGYGKLLLSDAHWPEPTVELGANVSAQGPWFSLTNGEHTTIEIRGGNMPQSGFGGNIEVFDAMGLESVTIAGTYDHADQEGLDNGGRITMRRNQGLTESIVLDAADDRILIRPTTSGDPPAKIMLDGTDGGPGGGGVFEMLNGQNNTTVKLDADQGNNDAALMQLRHGDGSASIAFDAEHEHAFFYNDDEDITAVIDGTTDDGGSGGVFLWRAGDCNAGGCGPAAIALDAENGHVFLHNDSGDVTAVMDGTTDAGQSGAIYLWKAGDCIPGGSCSSDALILHADYGGSGKSRVVTDIVEIRGADLAEKFPTSEASKPGMVMAIDPDNPGQLCVARGAYNRRVAGVVSGANDFSVGAILGSLPGHEDAPAIALSGRVYVSCDASNGAIQPGDLLTTSATPGYAMKVTDHGQAQGAIIGKAMTGLSEGKGMVLVLVSLQ